MEGVALGDIDVHSASQGVALSGTGLVARLGTLVAAAVCVPGVALGDIDAHAAWQAWHLRHHITNYWRHRRAFCVAGVAFYGITSPLAWRHRRAFCVAGVPFMA